MTLPNLAEMGLRAEGKGGDGGGGIGAQGIRPTMLARPTYINTLNRFQDTGTDYLHTVLSNVPKDDDSENAFPASSVEVTFQEDDEEEHVNAFRQTSAHGDGVDTWVRLSVPEFLMQQEMLLRCNLECMFCSTRACTHTRMEICATSQ
jgi:hypothetical protein